MTEVLSVFLGLRPKTVEGRAFVETIMPTLKEVMRESWTYQAMIREAQDEGRAAGEATGRVVEAQGLIIRLGERRFGKPSEAVERRIRAVADVDQLNAWADRLLTADGWDALLAD